MEHGAVLRCCGPRPRIPTRRTPFGNASSTRTTAPRFHSDGHSDTRRTGIMPCRMGQFPTHSPARYRNSSLKGLAMDTVTAFAPCRPELLPSVAVAPNPDGHKTLVVTATYRLSEEGRKASLLAGGDGRALQRLTVLVPAN